MIPEISEFSYGFALVNELVGWTALHAAPIFPSLIEEGKVGRGYDVKLDRPGVPLLLQFKRSDYMKTRGAREIHKYRLDLDVPFYRFAITERNRSFQHISLISLEAEGNLVFYAAPMFHTLDEINSAWASQRVVERSIFVSPNEIGLINDNERHWVSFDELKTYFCSEPRNIAALRAEDLREKLEGALAEDARPMREQLPDWLRSIDRAALGRRALFEKLKTGADGRVTGATGIPQPEARQATVAFEQAPEGAFRRRIQRRFIRRGSVEIRSAKPLDPERKMLREISDKAMYKFGVQMIVVQATDKKS
ncbi:hypothetical protein [Parvibaculum sp.]|jgi:hypothetical protein|uniref:hypothetical protein n=1 Tax=Parvibaculum sp. TaxID=2024848 RepID=UPI000C4A282A|nr:hypothetical protein [Parvibaculum sp.]MAM95040.1 hypothetical protein [Parvibaculum sp.]HCX67828.1 hypothetical protein [Rhodobiaceae bacterium]